MLFCAGMILHGIDRFGRVDGVDGEYLVTRFHHVYLMPIVPIESEWVMASDLTGLYGRRCRLSGKSVLAAYLRTWGIGLSFVILLVAATGAWSAVIVAAGLGALSLTSLARRDRCDPRERDRAALQRPVLGTALDPLRLPHDTAVHLLPAAEARFAAVSGGFTAFDVARLGASSPAQAAHAFVVLRLLASLGGDHAAVALAASNRILERQRSVGEAGAPYRVAWAPRVAAAAPLVEAYLLRPHRWYGGIATATLVIGGLIHGAGHATLCHHCDSKVDIAGTAVKKAAFEAYPQWRTAHPDAPCPTDRDLGQYFATAKLLDPWGNRYQIRCDDLPAGAVGIAVWSIGENQRDQQGAGDDHASWR